MKIYVVYFEVEEGEEDDAYYVIGYQGDVTVEDIFKFLKSANLHKKPIKNLTQYTPTAL